jgi:hypothetical protein
MGHPIGNEWTKWWIDWDWLIRLWTRDWMLIADDWLISHQAKSAWNERRWTPDQDASTRWWSTALLLSCFVLIFLNHYCDGFIALPQKSSFIYQKRGKSEPLFANWAIRIVSHKRHTSSSSSSSSSAAAAAASHVDLYDLLLREKHNLEEWFIELLWIWNEPESWYPNWVLRWPRLGSTNGWKTPSYAIKASSVTNHCLCWNVRPIWYPLDIGYTKITNPWCLSKPMTKVSWTFSSTFC